MTDAPVIDWQTWRNGELYIWSHTADDGRHELKCHWYKGPQVTATFEMLQKFGNGELPAVGQVVDIDGYKATVIHLMRGFQLAFLLRLDESGSK